MDRRRERKILALADQVVEAVMGAGLVTGEVRTRQVEKASALVAEILRLLEPELAELEGQELSFLKQLLTQKLPDPKVLESFGAFKADLEEVISEGIALKKGADAEVEAAEARDLSLKGDGDAGQLTTDTGELPGGFEETTAEAPEPPGADEDQLESTTPADFGEASLVEPGEEISEVPEDPEEAGLAAAVPALQQETSKAPQKPQGPREPGLGAAVSDGLKAAEAAQGRAIAPAVVERALRLGLPGARVVSKQNLGQRVTVSWVLPEHGVAVEDAGVVEQGAAELAAACRERGLRLLLVRPEDLANPRRLARRVRGLA